MKHIVKSFIVFAVVLAVAGAGAFAWAKGMPMMAGKANPKAAATMSLSKESLSIEARGLKPKSVYTVWFVSMMPEKSQAGVGAMPYMFKTDAKGKGTFTASLSEPPYGKWQMVMLHPDGDPGNMNNMVEALSAKVPDGN